MKNNPEHPAFTLQLLGSAQPDIVLYLEKPPLLPAVESSDNAPVSCSELITLNGNNWRKILTIFAKLVVPQAELWRDYRDQQLLQQREAIAFSTTLVPAKVHIIAGKASWQRLGFAPKADEALDDQGRLFAIGNTLLTPYLDYRQFPNELVTQARHWLNRL